MNNVQLSTNMGNTYNPDTKNLYLLLADKPRELQNIQPHAGWSGWCKCSAKPCTRTNPQHDAKGPIYFSQSD